MTTCCTGRARGAAYEAAAVGVAKAGARAWTSAGATTGVPGAVEVGIDGAAGARPAWLCNAAAVIAVPAATPATAVASGFDSDEVGRAAAGVEAKVA